MIASARPSKAMTNDSKLILISVCFIQLRNGFRGAGLLGVVAGFVGAVPTGFGYARLVGLFVKIAVGTD